MPHTVSRFEEVITRFCRILPTQTDTAPASDPHEPWKRLAPKAIKGGYFKSADEFALFVEDCLRSLAFEQFMHDRAHAIKVRSLADATAHRWACARTPKNAPSANAIAGLAQSDCVVSGEFRSLRAASNDSDTER